MTSAKVYHLQIPSVGLPYWPMVLKTDYDALAAELAVANTSNYKSLWDCAQKDMDAALERIRSLEAALLEGIKAVNGLLARNKDLTAYKAAGDWRESVKTLVVNYGTAEHPCSVPPPANRGGVK